MKRKRFLRKLGLGVLLTLGSTVVASAQEAATKPAPYIDSGNTAWMLIATALVFLMTIPGLAFFYGGLVRSKNILNVLMQCFVAAAVITLQWVIIGYSLSFGSSDGPLKSIIGGFDWAFLNGIGLKDVSPYFISQETARIPHVVFIMFQCMFAIITPALIIGAFAERIKFSGYLLFIVLWTTLIYDPVAHWIWSADGWLYKLGALDFAGGTVVHINAGIAALITAIMIGKRRHYMNSALPPHNIPFVVMGAGMLWFGWFGFNAGSGLAADWLAGNAFLVTHVATAAAAFTWLILDWTIHGKPTVIGVATAAVAGLVAITPAAGFVNITGALCIGISVSIICFVMVSYVKTHFGYDDSLDAFGVHGIGGLWGALATGLFATATVNGYDGLFYGNAMQFVKQLLAAGVTLGYTAIGTTFLFWLVDKLVGIRVNDKEEAQGLDYTQHKEVAYTSID